MREVMAMLQQLLRKQAADKASVMAHVLHLQTRVETMHARLDTLETRALYARPTSQRREPH